MKKPRVSQSPRSLTAQQLRQPGHARQQSPLAARHTPPQSPYGRPSPALQPKTMPRAVQTKAAQTKPPGARPAASRPVPPAPPAFRPTHAPSVAQPKSQVAQPKMQAGTLPRKSPPAPPVYRPQSIPKVLQTKTRVTASPHNAARAQTLQPKTNAERSNADAARHGAQQRTQASSSHARVLLPARAPLQTPHVVQALKAGAVVTAPPPRVTAGPSSNVIQRQWVFHVTDPGFPLKSVLGYTWQGTGPQSPTPPTITAHVPIPQLPSPPVGPGTIFTFTENEFYGLGGWKPPSGPKDVYNPFNRFLPHPGGEVTFLGVDNLSSPDFTKVGGHQPLSNIVGGSEQRTDTGYPVSLTTNTGKTLNYLLANPFGATYTENPTGATYDILKQTNQPQPLAKIPKWTTSTLLETNLVVDLKAVQRFRGTRNTKIGKKPPSQGQVMGCEAWEVAQAAGYTGKDWEWLHLIAYELGGKDMQNTDNLVCGTTETNTAMIMIEDAIVDALEKGLCAYVIVLVRVAFAEPAYRVAGSIAYEVNFYDGSDRLLMKQPMEFIGIMRYQPSVIENKYVRYMLRFLLQKASDRKKDTMYG